MNTCCLHGLFHCIFKTALKILWSSPTPKHPSVPDDEPEKCPEAGVAIGCYMGSCCTAERSQGVVAPEGPGASCTARVPSGRGQERGALCCQAVPSPGIVPPEVSWHPLVCVLSLINIPISTYLFVYLPQPVLHCQMRTQILHSHSSVVQVCFPVNCCGKFLLIVLNLRGRSPSLIH